MEMEPLTDAEEEEEVDEAEKEVEAAAKQAEAEVALYPSDAASTSMAAGPCPHSLRLSLIPLPGVPPHGVDTVQVRIAWLH